MASGAVILLVEDNPDDEALSLRALRRNNILNEVVVARDGHEALDYLFGEGRHAGRERLYPQARGFHAAHGSRAPARAVLARAQRAAAVPVGSPLK